MSKNVRLLAVIGVFVGLFLAFNPAYGGDVKELVVGEICALTGPTSSTHLMCMSGTKDYLEYVNENGGVEGKKGKAKFRVITYDSQYVAAKAKDGFARLKEEGMIVLTHCAAGHSDALLSDHERAKIPLVTGSLGVASMWSDWVYGNSHPGVANLMRTWALWAKSKWEKDGKPGGKLVLGAIEADEPWTPLVLWDIDTFAKENGMQIVTEKMPKGTTDATPQLSRLKMLGAREIFVLSSAPGSVVALKSAKAMGLTIPLTQSAGSYLGDVIDLGGAELAEGYQGSYFFEPISKNPALEDSEGMKLARKLWEKNHPGARPKDMYIVGLLSGMIIAEASRLALNEVSPDDLNGEALKKYGLDQIRDWDNMGLTTPLSFYAGDLDSHIGQATVWYWVAHNGYVDPLTEHINTTKYRIPKKK